MDSQDSTGDGPDRPVDKLTALRLGRKLVTEVPASRPGRRAFVDISPTRDRSDDRARDEGWAREDRGRRFHLRQREYDADRLDGFDHDIGAVLAASADAADEAALRARDARTCRKAAPPVVPVVPPSWWCERRCGRDAWPVSARATPAPPGPPCRRPRHRPGRPGPRRGAGPP
ncbi:hypothetical protein [Streptomyces virginiae]|uniref:Uncharacterized protein n=1 Tax=Streptomyces virginiae TaxID=1961 RepID=A0ABZ1TE69_STRVG|nr:hypothetical protein [Streptomyces virginiae]